VQISNSSNSNTVSKNNLTNCDYGVSLDHGSKYNVVSENQIERSNEVGVAIETASNNNSVVANTIAYSLYGIRILWSSDNKFFYNNIISNAVQKSVTVGYSNEWDDGYPSGGNYWSDYGGVDFCNGPYQDIPGGDGIGDSVYEINANNLDNYPLMESWVSPDIPDVAVLNVSASKDFVGRGGKIDFELVVRNRRNKTENVEVTFYVNGTFIHLQQFLVSNRYYLYYQFTWDTNGFAYGNYTVTAVLEPLEGERNLADNTFNCSAVRVTILGDVNGDFEVQLDDLLLLARAFGTQPGDAVWNSDADIDGNGEVRLVDVVTLAYNYGKHYP
jgi:hypothetical protein